MVAVQSFWCKPFLNNNKNNLLERYLGGFPNLEYFYYSWMISFLQLKKVFGEVRLITDDNGKELLIDYLKIPYDHVSLDLNKIQDERADMWTLGKIYCYSSIKEPFVHCDGDLIVFEDLKNKVQNKDLFSEYHTRTQDANYTGFVKYLVNSTLDLPISVIEDVKGNVPFFYEEYNTGLFGGIDYSFINEYAKIALNLYYKNKLFFEKSNIHLSFFGIICEQYILNCEVKMRDKEMYPIKDGTKASPNCKEEIILYESGESLMPFIHLNGPQNKSDKIVLDFLDKLVSSQYPDIRTFFKKL